MKTEALKQALDNYGFDAAFGGARRDEEKSRAKERIFSFRSKSHAWDPRNQRPELWHVFNTRIQTGESIRVFPLSNWTELDVWQYIRCENIPSCRSISPSERPVVKRDGDAGSWSMTSGCRSSRASSRRCGWCGSARSAAIRLTGAIESDAATLDDIVAEMVTARTSRSARAG